MTNYAFGLIGLSILLAPYETASDLCLFFAALCSWLDFCIIINLDVELP